MSTTINDNPARDGRRNGGLQFLDDISGYRVHHDDIDPRGYVVKLNSGETVGEVEGLLADVSARVVRYVEVEMDRDVIDRHERGLYGTDDRHALLPVGLIHIDRENRTVTLNGVAYDHLTDYPRFDRKHGYTTGHELDTADYLAGFHEYGATYDRERYATPTYRDADRLDDEFYTSDFYGTRSTRPIA